MPVVRLVIEYDGTRYVGWQVQPNGPSVQAEVERALEALHKAPRRVVAAGRTDAGVHAEGQVASFPEARPLPIPAYVQGMNALLPKDVAVRAASVEPDGFDARRSARGKRYRYRIENGPTRDPLSRRTSWQVFRPLDVAAMADAVRKVNRRGEDRRQSLEASLSESSARLEAWLQSGSTSPSGRVERLLADARPRGDPDILERVAALAYTD